ncbi:conserved hypothetical protein [Chloroherpeton thalassium ATCC 35110]|uniref:Holin of 3TMs, for gene-transfer release n=1 Tax=Chloroherpeton thalassium (strain ATCC 35110 / GB-78) TaxID=517418 RepID=B3QTJ9_CHLT3|nr:3TM-type holin [Chloroherpeton thalassium]ACF12745.1 conserved hypothetical protein [Chloroherpeton thalassium ATCC 35110]
MSVLGFFNDAGAGLVAAIGKAVDAASTTDEERLQLKAQIEALVYDHSNRMAAELTERLKADMASDNWLAKSVRPLLLIGSFVLFFLASLADGNFGGFQIKDIYIPIYKEIMLTGVMFYFGSRGIEKISQIRKQ